MDDDETNRRIAGNVRLLMARTGTRPYELADRAGITRPTLTRRLAGGHRGQWLATECVRIADALGVPVADVFDLQPDRARTATSTPTDTLTFTSGAGVTIT